MSEFHLDTYLAAQQAGGTPQGEGRFTISHEKAAEKRAQFSSVRKHSWVLKIIQAAVAWDCRHLSVKQSRTTSTFHLLSPNTSKLPDCKQLVEAILIADFENQQPEHALATALRIIVERSHLSFMISIDQAEGEHETVYAGAHFSEMTETGRKKIRSSWPAGLTLAIHHIPHTEANRLILNYIPIRRNGLPVVAELDNYAYTCPIPLSLDGRRIDGIYRTPALGWSFRKKPLALRGLNFPEKLSPRLTLSTDAIEREFTMNSPKPTEERRGVETPQYQAYVLLVGAVARKYMDLQSEAKSHVRWVRDGVLVESERLDVETSHLSIEVFVNAEGLATDLSGFSLRRDENFKQRRTAALESAAEQLELELELKRDICAEEPSADDDQDQPNGNPISGFLGSIARRIRESQAAPSISSGFPALKHSYLFELKRIWISISTRGKAEAERLRQIKEEGKAQNLARLEEAAEKAKQKARRLNQERYQKLQSQSKKDKATGRITLQTSDDESDPDWLRQLQSKDPTSGGSQRKYLG